MSTVKMVVMSTGSNFYFGILNKDSVKGITRYSANIDDAISKEEMIAFIKANNIGELLSISCSAVVITVVRPLNKQEKLNFRHLISGFSLARDAAVPNLENQMFEEMFGGK